MPEQDSITMEAICAGQVSRAHDFAEPWTNSVLPANAAADLLPMLAGCSGTGIDAHLPLAEERQLRVEDEGLREAGLLHGEGVVRRLAVPHAVEHLPAIVIRMSATKSQAAVVCTPWQAG